MNPAREAFLMRALSSGQVSVAPDGVKILGARGQPVGTGHAYGWTVRVTGERRQQATFPASNIVWYAAGRTIPPGFVLSFKDGDRHNHRLDNLELITRSELTGRAHRAKENV